MAYETLIVETEDYVTLIRLNRPDAMNALNSTLMRELAAAVRAAEANDKVRCIAVTGSEKAFAAGADVREMAEKSFIDVFFDDLFAGSNLLQALHHALVQRTQRRRLPGARRHERRRRALDRERLLPHDVGA